MAEILPFAIGDPRRTRHRRSGAGESVGEIVIFPGIRIEYHDGPPTPPTKGDRRGKSNSATGALSA
jgi:hypothetical protein